MRLNEPPRAGTAGRKRPVSFYLEQPLRSLEDACRVRYRCRSDGRCDAASCPLVRTCPDADHGVPCR